MFSMEKDKDTKSIYFGIGYGKFRSVEWFEENGAPLLQIVISTQDEARMEKPNCNERQDFSTSLRYGRNAKLLFPSFRAKRRIPF